MKRTNHQELVGLKEWSLLASWRAKFDLDSYIPTLAVLQDSTVTIGFFSGLIRDIKIREFRKGKTQEQMFRLNKIRKTMQQRLQPVLSLIPEVPVKISDDKSKFIIFELKIRAGQPAGSTSYKKYVQVFEEGSPQHWIELMQDLREIWTQNSINRRSDRTAIIRSLLRMETLTAFKSALLDARTEGMEDDDVEAPTSDSNGGR